MSARTGGGGCADISSKSIAKVCINASLQPTAKAYASLPLTLLTNVGIINACQYLILRLNVEPNSARPRVGRLLRVRVRLLLLLRSQRWVSRVPVARFGHVISLRAPFRVAGCFTAVAVSKRDGMDAFLKVGDCFNTFTELEIRLNLKVLIVDAG